VNGCTTQRKIKSARHDAENEAALAINRDAVSNNRRVCVEPSNPKPIAENHLVGMARLIFIRQNVAPEHRRNADRGKEIGGYAQAVQGFGRHGTVACKVEHFVAINSHRSKGAGSSSDLLSVAPEGPVGMRRLELGELRSDLYKFRRMSVRQRRKEHGLHRREDHRSCSYAQCDRHQGNSCHSGSSP